VYPAIIIATAVYGVINGCLYGVAIGVYASVAALFYNAAYVYMRSLWASITLQVASIYVIAIVINTGLWSTLRGWGDGVLTGIVVLSVLAILILYRFMLQSHKKYAAAEKTAVAA
jgi:hypothetical protein